MYIFEILYIEYIDLFIFYGMVCMTDVIDKFQSLLTTS